MKNYFLNRVRLSYYFLFLIVGFSVLSFLIDGQELSRAALTLFSVNSFLYGFYISPIVKSQRDRIDMLHKLVRVEASKLYEIALYSRRIEGSAHKTVMTALNKYASSAYADHDTQGKAAHEELMTELIEYKGVEKDAYKEMLKSAFAVQQNRSEINRLLVAKVYRNEWIIMAILFSITICFILLIEVPANSILLLVAPILCAGLSMLMIILAKMSTLTHKRARSIWDPLDTLASTKFRRINEK